MSSNQKSSLYVKIGEEEFDISSVIKNSTVAYQVYYRGLFITNVFFHTSTSEEEMLTDINSVLKSEKVAISVKIIDATNRLEKLSTVEISHEWIKPFTTLNIDHKAKTYKVDITAVRNISTDNLSKLKDNLQELEWIGLLANSSYDTLISYIPETTMILSAELVPKVSVNKRVYSVLNLNIRRGLFNREEQLILVFSNNKLLSFNSNLIDKILAKVRLTELDSQ